MPFDNIATVRRRAHACPKYISKVEVKAFAAVQRGLSIRVFEWLFNRIAEEESAAVGTS